MDKVTIDEDGMDTVVVEVLALKLRSISDAPKDTKISGAAEKAFLPQVLTRSPFAEEDQAQEHFKVVKAARAIHAVVDAKLVKYWNFSKTVNVKHIIGYCAV